MKTVIGDLKRNLKHGEEERSILGMFLNDPSAFEVAEQIGVSEEKLLKDVALTMIMAGMETTATALSWTLWELAQHPEAVEKARAEIAEVCGESPVSFQCLPALRYVAAVANEGMRLHSPVPLDFKTCIQRDVWPDGAVIPAGTCVGYFIYGQGRSKQIWGEDALSFRPDRFLELSKKPSSYTFTVFNAGPRECLGRNLAEMEMTMFLANFLRDFDFELAVKPSDVHSTAGMTNAVNHLPMRLRRRGQEGLERQKGTSTLETGDEWALPGLVS